MGVSGCGKSTVGQLLANELKIPFFDGDDFHPSENITKMESGIPLNDDDRKGWLESLNQLAIKHAASGAVIACSALKELYRVQLSHQLDKTMMFVYLEGTFEEINNRLKQRTGHYMPANLLKSQFDTLEPPTNALRISISKTPEKQVSEILNNKT